MSPLIRFVICFTLALVWFSALTNSARADTCTERLKSIQSNASRGRFDVNQLDDPDCDKGVMAGTALSWAAAVITAITAVTVGLGTAGISATTNAPTSALAKHVVQSSAATTTVPPLIVVPRLAEKLETASNESRAQADTFSGREAYAKLLDLTPADRVVRYEGKVYLKAFDTGELPSGIHNLAYHTTQLPNGESVIDPNQPLMLVQDTSQVSTLGVSSTATTPLPDAMGTASSSLAAPVEIPADLAAILFDSENVRGLVLDLINPAKVLDFKFEKIEKARQEYAIAQKNSGMPEKETKMQELIRLVMNELRISAEGARVLLEMSEQKWNALATLISGLG